MFADHFNKEVSLITLPIFRFNRNVFSRFSKSRLYFPEMWKILWNSFTRLALPNEIFIRESLHLVWIAPLFTHSRLAFNLTLIAILTANVVLRHSFHEWTFLLFLNILSISRNSHFLSSQRSLRFSPTLFRKESYWASFPWRVIKIRLGVLRGLPIHF